MNIKIQGGGGGKTANSGSSFNLANYLNHENEELQQQGQRIEPFFNANNQDVSFIDMVTDLDSNKRNLGKADAKFYMVTVSPSAEEQALMGSTLEEQSTNFKEYINNEIMQQYAQNFNKGLNAEDIKYYAKIHRNRGDKVGEQMHAHIIVSRKDQANKVKLSPLTNHRNTNRGQVKGGFNRSNFYNESEKGFDKHFNHNRDIKQSYEYLNTLKNGSATDKLSIISKANKQNLTKQILKKTQTLIIPEPPIIKVVKTIVKGIKM